MSFFCLHLHMHHMFILHFPRGSKTMGLPQQCGSKSGLNTLLGRTQRHNWTKNIFTTFDIFCMLCECKNNLMLYLLTLSKNPEKFPCFCVLVVAMSVFQSFGAWPQQYTYMHIPTCIHLLFQIAVKLPLRNYSVTDFSIPSIFMVPDSYAPGLSRRVL